MDRIHSIRDKIVIVGNGFDLAHGYRTQFGSFVEYVKDQVIKEFRDLWEEYFTENCKNREECVEMGEGFITCQPDVRNWTDFENGICAITSNMFLKSMSNDISIEEYKKIHDDISRLNGVFLRLQELLVDYLRRETVGQEKRFKKLDIIEKYLHENDYVINFNYTDIVEQYSKNVFYIHGSLKENKIVLGYDRRFEPCLEEQPFMRWYKEYGRTELELARMCRHFSRCFNKESEAELIDKIRGVFEWERHRGIYWSSPEENEYSIILRSFRRGNEIKENDYCNRLVNVRTMVIIGHSVLSDRAVISTILRSCKKLERIILFCYKNEEDGAKRVLSRVEYLRRFTDIIELVYY